MSRLLKIIGLFCRMSSLLQGSFAKETYDFKEPTNRSHPIQYLQIGVRVPEMRGFTVAANFTRIILVLASADISKQGPTYEVAQTKKALQHTNHEKARHVSLHLNPSQGFCRCQNFQVTVPLKDSQHQHASLLPS